MARPSVDVVVPFRGGPAELEELCSSLSRISRFPGDSVTVADNTPGAAARAGPRDGEVVVVHAAEVAVPGYARNRGVARGAAEWLVFIDADTVPSLGLLDAYFEPPPRSRTALLAGGVRDESVPPGGNPVARHAQLRRMMGQEHTLRLGEWSFAQTANAACRRAAFEEVGGFREDIRAAEDADLTFRLRAAGWETERREAAAVVHRSRRTVRGFVAQNLCHGAGGAWLDRTYPGSLPARGRPGLMWWGVRFAATGLVAAVRSRDRDRALIAVLDPLDELAYEFGRSLPNERPLPSGSLWARLAALGRRPG